MTTTIKDINFILVLVFLSLPTTEKMFSPWNYTFRCGKKSFLRGENFIRRNYQYTFLRRIKLYSAELNFTPRNYTFHCGKKSFLREENFIPRNYTFLRGIILLTSCGCSPSQLWTHCIHILGCAHHPYRGSRSHDFSPRWKV